MNPDFDKRFGADLLATIPLSSGVYLFKDAAAQVIYVGKAKSLRRRLAQYRLAKRQKKNRKMRAIVRAAVSLEFQICLTENEALLLENRLIQTHRPLFNVAGAYAFLYPYLGLRWTNERQLTLCYSTDRELIEGHGFEVFGAYRSRHRVKAAFDAFFSLFSLVGHYDPKEREALLALPFVRVAGFRQMDGRWSESLRRLFRGEDSAWLGEILMVLLENSSARRHAAEVQIHIENLREFFLDEAQPLRRVLAHHGRVDSAIEQEERDPLFLASKALY